METDFLLRDEIPQQCRVWSPCGENGALNINCQTRINSTSGEPIIWGNDSVDLKMKYIIRLEWRKCTKAISGL